MTEVISVERATAPAAMEWWQLWAARRSAWWAARPTLAARAARTRAIGLWLAIAWVGALLVWMPELRLGVRAYLGCVWVVVAWYALARTKSLTWSGLLRFFSACVPWSLAVGLLAQALATSAADTSVRAVGPTVAIASITEETLKLVPVVVIAVLAPRRAERFATVDWFLLGLASGSAFLAVEEGARRIALETGNLSLLDRALTAPGQVPQGWVTFQLWPTPTGWTNGLAAFSGHAVTTALTAGCVGLSIALWQSVRGAAGPGPLAARLLAGTLPLAALLSSIADHAAYNVQGNGSFEAGPDGTPLWLDPSSSTVPAWMRVPWSAIGHGHGRGQLLVVVVLVALLIDARRLAARPASNILVTPRPAWVSRAAARLVDVTSRWPSFLARAGRAVVTSVLELAWITVRDLLELVSAHARVDGERRLAAMRRGLLFTTAQRLARELGYESAAAQGGRP